MDITDATKDTFAPFVGQQFSIDTPEGRIDLMLDNVKVFEGSGIRDSKVVIDDRELPPRQAFALTFEGPREPVLPPRTYRIEHAQIGALDLFLSGFRQDMDCMLYESVFN